MSQRSLEVKKALELLTKEYLINDRVRRINEVINSQVISFLVGDSKENVVWQLGRRIKAILEVKEFQVWVRDVMNGKFWTVADGQQVSIDTVADPSFAKLMVMTEPNWTEFRGSESLIHPIHSAQSQMSLGLVQVAQQESN